MRKVSFWVIAGLCAALIAGCGNTAAAGSSSGETEAATEAVSAAAEEKHGSGGDRKLHGGRE